MYTKKDVLGFFVRWGMRFQGCDSDSLSKPMGRRPDEKRERTEKSRGGVGERKPGPSLTSPTLRHSASAKTIMWARWKLSLDFLLLAGFQHAFGGFTALQTVSQRSYSQDSREQLAETEPKGYLQNKIYVKSFGKRWIRIQVWMHHAPWKTERKPVTQQAINGSLNYSLDPYLFTVSTSTGLYLKQPRWFRFRILYKSQQASNFTIIALE